MSSITTGRIKLDIEAHILRMLKPGPLTKTQIVTRLDTTRTYVDTNISELMKQGKVRQILNESEAPGKWAFKLVND